MCWNKGRLCWNIAKLFYFCHLKKLVRPESFGPYYVLLQQILRAVPMHVNTTSSSSLYRWAYSLRHSWFHPLLLTRVLHSVIPVSRQTQFCRPYLGTYWCWDIRVYWLGLSVSTAHSKSVTVFHDHYGVEFTMILTDKYASTRVVPKVMSNNFL